MPTQTKDKTEELWNKILKSIEKKWRKVQRKDLIKIFKKELKEAKQLNHRRLFVFGFMNVESIKEPLADLIDVFISISDKRVENLEFSFFGYRLRAKSENKKLDILKEIFNKKGIKIQGYSFIDSVRVMGRTLDGVIVDFTEDLPPNDIGRIVETVRGSGLVIFLAPQISQWAELKTKFHEYIVTIPWSLEDVKGRYIKRFIKKLVEHDGIIILEPENMRVIHPSRKISRAKKQLKKLTRPEAAILHRKIYRLAKTSDQIKTLKALEDLLFSPKKGIHKSVIITADRGRGKSAIVGIFIGALAERNSGRGPLGKYTILVTAPREYNAYTLFEFAKLALEKLRVRVKFYENPPELRGKGFVIAYVPPFIAPKIAKREKVELVVVDEAAGVPVPLLNELISNVPMTIFSGTIHGYEGAGRGFSIRFLSKLDEIEGLRYKIVKMKEPIRYGYDDPIEAWLLDTFLLDAKPETLTNEDLENINKKEVKFEELDLDEIILGQNEKDLKQFVGVYVFAHYRNEPKDFGIMADAPHYKAFALRLPSGKIVNAILVAQEGSLPKDLIWEIYKSKAAEPSGHLIPVAIEKHFRTIGFPAFLGYRIVRIATHPDVMRHGLGSLAIKELLKYAKKSGCAWIGAGFGANRDLLRFWLKNKFVPVHVSPMRNKISGEYTTIVIRPLNEKLEVDLRLYYREFRIRFVDWLRYVHYDMDPMLAQLLLKGGHIWKKIEEPYIYSPRLTEIQAKRVDAYHRGILSYELTSDAIQELVKSYFIDENPDKPNLSDYTELLFIARVLQARTWSQIMEYFDSKRISLDKKTLMNLFGKGIYTIFKFFVKKEMIT